MMGKKLKMLHYNFLLQSDTNETKINERAVLKLQEPQGVKKCTARF
jgi:hypothetical protein